MSKGKKVTCAVLSNHSYTHRYIKPVILLFFCHKFQTKLTLVLSVGYIQHLFHVYYEVLLLCMCVCVSTVIAVNEYYIEVYYAILGKLT